MINVKQYFVSNFVSAYQTEIVQSTLNTFSLAYETLFKLSQA